MSRCPVPGLCETFLCALFIPRFEMITSSLRLMKEGHLLIPCAVFRLLNCPSYVGNSDG